MSVTSSQAIQRLTRESELLVREKEELQREIEETKSAQPEPTKHSDADYRYVESKLKVATVFFAKLYSDLFLLC